MILNDINAGLPQPRRRSLSTEALLSNTARNACLRSTSTGLSHSSRRRHRKRKLRSYVSRRSSRTTLSTPRGWAPTQEDWRNRGARSSVRCEQGVPSPEADLNVLTRDHSFSSVRTRSSNCRDRSACNGRRTARSCFSRLSPMPSADLPPVIVEPRSAHGKITPRLLLLNASVAVFWLFLSIKVLEARKWK